MNKELNFKKVSHELFSCIGEILSGKDITAPESDALHVFSLAAKNGVSQILSFSDEFMSLLPDDARAAAEKKKLRRIKRALSQDYEYSVLKEKLCESGIDFLPMKGIVIRELYPVREMRSSNDIDIYYDKTKRDKVRTIMSELGYEMYHSDANHDEYLKGEINIEMHHNLCMQIDIIDKYYSDLWQRLEKYDGHEHRFSVSDEYIYAVFHAMKHFKFGGIDARPILDMYILEKTGRLDFGYIEKELEKIELVKFGTSMRELASAWMEGRELTDEQSLLCEFILLGGYGDVTALVQGAGEGSSKARYLVKRVFPSFRYMKEKYPSLEKVPYALPFYYVKRIFDFSLHESDRAAKEKSILTKDSKDKQKKLREIFDITGL